MLFSGVISDDFAIRSRMSPERKKISTIGKRRGVDVRNEEEYREIHTKGVALVARGYREKNYRSEGLRIVALGVANLVPRPFCV